MVRTILVHIFCVRPATNQSNRTNLPQKRGTKVRFGAEGYTVAIQLSKSIVGRQ
jgi:hypothetical protein